MSPARDIGRTLGAEMWKACELAGGQWGKRFCLLSRHAGIDI